MAHSALLGQSAGRMKMKTIVAGIVALFLSIAAEAASISKDGYLGCQTKSDFSSMISAVSQKDMDSFRALVLSGRCIPLAARQKISIVDFSIFGGTEILYKGVRIFTVNEAINAND